MARIVRRTMGIGFDAKPIPPPKLAYSLLISTAVSGKMTYGDILRMRSMPADHARAIVIEGSKGGEIATKCAAMCSKHGRKVVIVDAFGVLDELKGGTKPHKPGVR